MQKKRLRVLRGKSQIVESVPGVFRMTLSYNEQIMQCLFVMKQGAQIPLHKHQAVQVGYVTSGKIQFFDQDGNSFEAEAGDSYLFESDELHGAQILEDCEVLECFTPLRLEFLDSGRGTTGYHNDNFLH